MASSPADRIRFGTTPDVAARWRHDPSTDVPVLIRRALTAQLRTWGLGGIDEDDLLLVLTELVSNAVEHARTPVTVTVGLHPTHGDNQADGPMVRIEVTDGSAAPPRLQPVDRYAARGRGLQVIEALASRWGHVATATGKTVWAELTPPAAIGGLPP